MIVVLNRLMSGMIPGLLPRQANEKKKTKPHKKQQTPGNGEGPTDSSEYATKRSHAPD